jgi:hypothetical protein
VHLAFVCDHTEGRGKLLEHSVDRIPLIYIASDAYSGSTLFDLLLGMLPEAWTLGEAQHLWQRIRDHMVCACGVPLAECPFWQPLIPKIATVSYSPLFSRFIPSYVIRGQYLPAMLWSRISPGLRDEIGQYGDLNNAYLRIVWDAAEAHKPNLHWLIDASKDAYRLYALHQSERFDMRVIHITKDPRAMVYSHVKNGRERDKMMVLRKSGRWLINNMLFNHIGHSLGPSRYRHVRYEDLARFPNKTMNELLEWLGMSPIETLDHMRLYESHAIGGNAMRWEDRPIMLDERWKHRLSKINQQIAWLIGLPLCKRFGYTWSEKK